MGVVTKSYPSAGVLFFASWKTYGGTERKDNDLIIVDDTAVVETWFDPLIKSNCRIQKDDEVYEIVGKPENINQRNQYLKFKVRRISGGA